MNKIDEFLTTNTKSVLCFLFSFICSFLVFTSYFDYVNIKDIHSKELINIDYVEGIVVDVDTPKTNTEIVVEGYEKEFYIHTSYIEDNEIKVGDYVTIYYSNNSPIRGNYYNIVNLEVNSELIYSLEEFKESTNPTLYLGLLIGSTSIFITLIVVGILLLNRDRLVDNVRLFVLTQKDNYNLTDEQVDKIVEMFEGNIDDNFDDLSSNKSKEEIYKMFKDSIYTKGKRIYTSGLELVENEMYGDIFFEVLMETVIEGELKVIYDDAYKCEDSIYVIYKINNKVALLNLFWEDDTKLFNIDNDILYFMNEKKKNPTKKENASFIEEIKKYNVLKEEIFKVE